MTAKQFMDWVYYDQLEPFGELRDDYRFASVVQSLWNIARDTKKHSEPFKITDFLLHFGEEAQEKPAKKQTWQEQKSMAKTIAAAFNKMFKH